MKRLLFTTVFLLLATQAHATRYWAATTGSDANACAAVDGSADPGVYRTFSGAVSCATASGDEVYVKAGTYTSSATITNPASGVTIRGESATPANWPVLQPTGTSLVGVAMGGTRSNITFKYLKWDFTNATSADNAIEANAASVTNVTVEDFEILGPASGSALSTASAIRCGTGNDNWTIRRGKISRWRSSGSNPGAHGLYWSCSNGLIEHIEVTDVNGYPIQVYSSSASPTNNVLRNNYFHDDLAKSAVYIGGSSVGTTIYNNLFVNWSGSTGVQLDGNNSTTKVINNTIYTTANLTGINVVGCASACIIANNLISVGGTAIASSDPDVTETTNRETGGTACMIDPPNNFNLVESSACIDAGTVISAVGQWPGSAGRYVGSNPDQGAFEAPIRSSAVVEDASDTIYRITFSMPTQSTRDGTGLQTCTVGNIAVTVAGAGATESSCSTSASASRVDVTLGAAVTVGQALTDAYTRSTSPSLMDNVAIGNPNGTHGTNFHNAYIRTYGATAGTNNVDGGALPALTQSRFRFHQLRGTEASPVLLAAENTNLTLPRGAAFRLRIKFKTDDDPASTAFKLRYSKDAGAYTDIPDTMGSDYIAWYGTTGSSDIPSAGEATTELLTSDEASNTACAVVRSSSDYPLLDLNNSETECEYVLQISNSVSIGTTYDFRVYKSDNTALDTYTTTGRLTIGSYIAGW